MLRARPHFLLSLTGEQGSYTPVREREREGRERKSEREGERKRKREGEKERYP